MVFRLIVTIYLITIYLRIINGQLGYTQQINLYQDIPINNTHEGTVHTLHKHLPDLTTCFRSVTKICARGFWMAFKLTQFEGDMVTLHRYDNDLTCFDQSDVTPFKSIRHAVFLNTSIPALSMYSQEGYQGPETVLTQSEGLLVYGKSLVYTASSEWTLFEEHNYQGKSVCTIFNPDYDRLGIYGHFNVTQSFGLTQIGSILKGCHVPPTEKY